MIIRSIALRNIRSYNGGEETRLDLPEGVVLFEGDIGSGKSTLLYAIEFALFGLSDMKGGYLLSEGRKEGSVSLSFESAGTEYSIDRRLRVRGENIVQDECYIKAAGDRERLSPSDLKERVVSILGFNEPTHPKAESLVYRYAVFTPQEQMKEILTQDPEDRLHVIRRVLGAQVYQAAAENSEIVERRLKQISHGLKMVSEDLEEKKDEMAETSRAIALLESDLPRLREREASASRLVRSLDAEWKESMGQRESLRESEGRVPLLREDMDDLRRGISEDEEKLRGNEAQLRGEVEPLVRAFESMSKPPSKARDLQALLDKEKEKLTQARDAILSMEADLEKSRDLVARGVCPLCGQRISGDLHQKTEHAESELRVLNGLAKERESSVESLKGRLDQATEFEGREKEHARALADRTRLEDEVNLLRKRIQDSGMRLSRLRSELEDATARAKALKELSGAIDALQEKLNRAREDDKLATVELNRALDGIKSKTEELVRLSIEVKKKQKSFDEAQRLGSYQAWLSSYFRPTVKLVEEQTLAEAAARFNEHFQRFFTVLVDDPDMVVRVKENFSPLFEREGFEQEFEALSGGERTSMALAYRFALNSVVRESVASRPEIVILDEPTDGFSRDQVYKMRGLLDALDSRQVILVSHEKELESMADHVFRVQKKDGTSMVATVS